MNTLLKVIQLYKNEAALIEKAAENNREAQRLLFDLHAPKMLSICRYYIKDIHHAEEVMLNGFFKVFTKLKGFKKEGSFEGWVRRIMTRECLTYLRQKKPMEISTETIEINENYDSNINSDMEVDEIQKLIDNLPSGYRMVFVLYAIEGYKHHEIARMLNISEGTSKSQLHKARKLLQEHIKTLNKASNGAQ